MNEELPSISISRMTPKEHVLKLGSDCERCGHCCQYGSGYFLAEDIDRISKKMGIDRENFIKEFLEENEAFNTKVHKAKLNKKKDRPYGSCIFYEDGCKIHDIKPLHCRAAKGCGEHGTELSQWFVLNYLVNPADPESIRQWAQQLKSHPTIPGGQLRDLVKSEQELRDILTYKKMRR